MKAKVFFPVFLIMLSAFIFSFIFVNACGLSPLGHPIRFIVPSGFSGLFYLILDDTKGIDVPLNNGFYTYTIPGNGVLLLKSMEPFRQPHTESAYYDNQRELAVYSSDPLKPDPPNSVALRSIVTTMKVPHAKDGTTRMYYYVGTSEEVQQIQAKLSKGMSFDSLEEMSGSR